MNEKRSFGWLDLIVGILFVFIGFSVFINPGVSVASFVVAYGVIALSKGLLELVKFFILKKETNQWIWAILVMGIIDLLVGYLLLSDIYVGIIGIEILLPTWLLVSSIIGIIDLHYIKKISGVSQWVGVLLLVLSILASIIMMIQPGTATLTFAYMLGCSALTLGFTLVILAFEG